MSPAYAAPSDRGNLLNALQCVLPMARGYANMHRVGNNQEIVDHAAKVLFEAENANETPRVPTRHLQPCPYCAGEPGMLYDASIHHAYHVECPECDARGPGSADGDTAERRWNQIAAYDMALHLLKACILKKQMGDGPTHDPKFNQAWEAAKASLLRPFPEAPKPMSKPLREHPAQGGGIIVCQADHAGDSPPATHRQEGYGFLCDSCYAAKREGEKP